MYPFSFVNSSFFRFKNVCPHMAFLNRLGPSACIRFSFENAKDFSFFPVVHTFPMKTISENGTFCKR